MCLAHILQQHEDKCSKIKFHGGDGIGHQSLIELKIPIRKRGAARITLQMAAI